MLVTGEAVALDLRTAALPSRVLAVLVDALAQLLLLVVVGVAVAVSSVGLSAAAAQALGVVLVVLVTVVYPIGFETLLRGRTPGKAALGLRVVRDDGGPIGFRQALVRGLAGAFLEKPGISLFVLPVVVSLVEPRSKRVGDLLAGTVVLQERVPAQAPVVVQMPWGLDGWARTLDLSRLPDALALSVRQFVGRADALRPQAREELGGRLVAAVAAVTTPPPPPGTPGRAFLAAVLAERRRREGERLQAGRPATPPADPHTAAPVPYRPEPWQPAPPQPAPPQAAPPAPAPRRGGFAPPA